MDTPPDTHRPEDPIGSHRPMRPADFYTSLLFLALGFAGLGAACLYRIFG